MSKQSEMQARIENAKEWARSLLTDELVDLLNNKRAHLQSLGQHSFNAVLAEWQRRDQLSA